jgi:hypothetical protein
MPKISYRMAIKNNYPRGIWRLHNIKFPINKFNLKSAKKILKELNYESDYMHVVGNYYSFNQDDPEVEGAKYFSRKLDNGVIYTFQMVT